MYCRQLPDRLHRCPQLRSGCLRRRCCTPYVRRSSSHRVFTGRLVADCPVDQVLPAAEKFCLDTTGVSVSPSGGTAQPPAPAFTNYPGKKQQAPAAAANTVVGSIQPSIADPPAATPTSTIGDPPTSTMQAAATHGGSESRCGRLIILRARGSAGGVYCLDFLAHFQIQDLVDQAKDWRLESTDLRQQELIIRKFPSRPVVEVNLAGNT